MAKFFGYFKNIFRLFLGSIALPMSEVLARPINEIYSSVVTGNVASKNIIYKKSL